MSRPSPSRPEPDVASGGAALLARCTRCGGRLPGSTEAVAQLDAILDYAVGEPGSAALILGVGLGLARCWLSGLCTICALAPEPVNRGAGS